MTIPKELTFDTQQQANDYLKSIGDENLIRYKGCQFNFPFKFNNGVTKDVSFTNCIFTVDQSFQKKHFLKEVTFSECIFKGKVDFYASVFKETAYFYRTIFEKDVDFSETEFKQKMKAWQMEFKSDVSFKWANFREKANLTHMKVLKGNANFYGASFDQNMYLNDGDFKKLELERCVIDNSYFLDVKIKSAGRETFRIIKNEFLKQNDRIEALKYHAREMNAYWLELAKKVFKYDAKSFWEYLKILGDILILSLNTLSNRFGLSWMIGLIFTFTTTWLMYCWYLNFVCVCPPESLSFWKYYPQFLSPLHELNFIENAQLTNGAYVIDFLGRAVSSFGIYQTVQAFRKFGRF